SVSYDHLYHAVILRNDMSISDSIPDDFGHWYISSASTDRELIFLNRWNIFTSGLKPNEVVRYNLDTKKKDTVFSGLYFLEVMAIPHPDYYLLNGLTEKELNDQYEARRQEAKRTYVEGTEGDDTPFQPRGYWMIGNSKSKDVKKLGYAEYWPTVSSSGRFILFSRYSDHESEMKVVSVQAVSR
ncbi:MAG: hypothetical protein Q8896_02930, partial [Bacteroidota bacterium]|nr:hypothetical protein [Bacteroidota bacterium]